MVKNNFLLVALLLLSISFSSAIALDNPNIPIVREEVFDTNISVDSATFWETSDHGKLGAVSELMHNWLGGLQGGTVNEFYHLTSSQYTTLAADIGNWITSSELYTVLGNIHDQDLNTTSNVTFANVNITEDLFVSNNTIYIGDTISLSAGGAQGSILNVSGGNITVGTDGYYFGSGEFLTDIDWSSINFTNGTINANEFNGSSFTGGDFYGTYDWLAEQPWLNFNGTYLQFNESYFNDTVQELAEVKLMTSSLVVTSSGGSAAATSAILDFEIKQIIVTPNSLSTKYRFEAVETTNGNIIDKDRALHTGVWNIEKNHAIDDSVNITITSANPDDTFNVTFKYLNNFD